MLVLDASVAVSWAFPNGETGTSASSAEYLRSGAPALAPGVFPFEVANAMWLAARLGRINRAHVSRYFDDLLVLPIQVEVTEIARIYQNITVLAAEQEISIYDASYLELAIRERATLATLDHKLQAAAQQVGVSLLR